MQTSLPQSIAPMLARRGEPFDSDEHLFEVKWDGTRVLAFIEGGQVRLQNRRGTDVLTRYPELSELEHLPADTVLDGEVVVLQDGLPDFPSMLRREQARGPATAARLARALPATYVAFDLLYVGGASHMQRRLDERRAELAELGGAAASHLERLIVSEGVVGAGRAYFEGIRARALEGMMAKRLASPYLPGKRSDAWLKIKQTQVGVCAILGWQRSDDGHVGSLLIGVEDGGHLRYAGKVGSGWSDALRRRLTSTLEARAADVPLIACSDVGLWVCPGLFCKVSYLEVTGRGTFRAPVFLGLVDG